jgi:ABC-type thiamine transport system ATPase subunit
MQSDARRDRCVRSYAHSNLLGGWPVWRVRATQSSSSHDVASSIGLAALHARLSQQSSQAHGHRRTTDVHRCRLLAYTSYADKR